MAGVAAVEHGLVGGDVGGKAAMMGVCICFHPLVYKALGKF